MAIWFNEKHAPGVQLSIRVRKQIASVESAYQHIEIFDSYEFGRVLAIDGFIMLTEKDEFIYHEMMTHVPMAAHPSPERILVIGAGDGGIMRELAKYDMVKHVDLVEIDELVVELCKTHLPQTACGFDDARLRVHYEDGLRFVRRCANMYDLIIVDSTDPYGPGEGLFTMEFYDCCYKALKADGILVNQHESPFYAKDAEAMQRAHQRINNAFGMCRVYQAHIPTYPSGHWLFGFASKQRHPYKDFDANRWNALGIQTQYYNTNIHKGAFYLPNYVEALLKDVE